LGNDGSPADAARRTQETPKKQTMNDVS